MKKLRRVVSFLLVLSIVFTGMTISNVSFVKAADEESKELEIVLKKIKNLVNIPTSLTEFEYSVFERNNENIWELQWYNKSNDHSISVRADSKGNIVTYMKDQEEPEAQKELAKFSNIQAQKVAEDFLDKVIPNNSKDLRLISKNVSLRNQYDFTYQLYQNNIPVDFATYQVYVSKQSGIVTQYFCSDPKATDYQYPAAKWIDEKTAKDNFLKEIGVNLQYFTNEDYSNKKRKMFPGYILNNNFNDYAIDAKTGNKIELYFDEYIAYERDATGGKESTYGLSKEETKELTNLSGMIKKEKAISIVKGLFPLMKDKTVKESTLYKDRYGNQFYWDLYFENGSGSVDAKTGEIKNLYIWEDTIQEGNAITKEEGKTIAESLLKQITNGKFEQTRYVDNQKEESDSSYYTFSYIRQVNGIDVTDNDLIVKINKYTKEVIYFSSSWFEEVNFPSISNAMNSDKAFDFMKEELIFDVTYVKTEKDKVAPAYQFINKDNCILNPTNGARLDYKGEAYVKQEIPAQYPDIVGHSCEKAVTQLLDSGFYLPGEKFYPDQTISIKNFVKYLYSRNYAMDLEDELFEYEKKSLKIADLDSEMSLTRQKAAQIAVSYLGYQNVGKLDYIFGTLFKDVVDKEYLGYATISYGLEILQVDEQGNFNPTKEMTNADAALLIYKLLQVE